MVSAMRERQEKLWRSALIGGATGLFEVWSLELDGTHECGALFGGSPLWDTHVLICFQYSIFTQKV